MVGRVLIMVINMRGGDVLFGTRGDVCLGIVQFGVFSSRLTILVTL